MNTVCSYCKSNIGKYTCGKCRKVRYCSSECQKKDWPQHKLVCKKESIVKESKLSEFSSNYLLNDGASTNIALKSFFDDKIVAVNLEYSPEKGRYLVASRDIPKGEVVLASDSYEKTTKGSSLGKSCYNCLKAISIPYKPCSKCGIAYCCEDCFLDSEVRHYNNCEGICKVKNIMIEHKNTSNSNEIQQVFDRDILLLYIHIISRYNYEKKNPQKNYTGFRQLCTFHDILELYSHQQELCQHYSATYTQAEKEAHYYYDELKSFSSLTFEVFFRLLLILRYNATPIKDAMNSLGTGIYPTGAYINHSCLPNICLREINGGDTLVFRAIRDIKKGEEVCYSYIDTMLNRETRLSVLKQSFLFTCKCPRCFIGAKTSLAGTNMNYYRSSKQDEFVCNALVCKNESHEHTISCYCRASINISNNSKDSVQCVRCSTIHTVKQYVECMNTIQNSLKSLLLNIDGNTNQIASIIYELLNSQYISILGPYNTTLYSLIPTVLYLDLSDIHNPVVYHFLLRFICQSIDCYKYIMDIEDDTLALLYMQLAMRLYMDIYKKKNELLWNDTNINQGKQLLYTYAKEASRILSYCYGVTDPLTVVCTNCVLQIEKVSKEENTE
ncbi:hypothetical protein WA158_004131 [Blastocystis sp. Blastoise]